MDFGVLGGPGTSPLWRPRDDCIAKILSVIFFFPPLTEYDHRSLRIYLSHIKMNKLWLPFKHPILVI